jgi:tetratricopeptide (TPR) repeat protein
VGGCDNRISTVRTSLGRFEAAEADCAEAVARGDDGWQLHERRAYASLHLPRPEVAALSLLKTLHAAPQAPATMARQADKHLAEGRNAEAVAAHRQALALESSAERHLSLALALQRAGQHLESHRHYELGLEIATPAQLSETIREVEFWLPRGAACSGILARLRARMTHHRASKP